MVAFFMLGAEAAQATVPAVAGAGLDLGRGAIIGAVVVAAALLAGLATFRNSSTAMLGFALTAAAGAVLAVWLGLIPGWQSSISLMLQGVFAAAALIYLSATISIIARRQLLGGVMFAGALTVLGVAIFNFFLAGEAIGLQRAALASVAGAALILSAIESFRGDVGARLILPGAAMVIAAPFVAGLGAEGALALAPQALFAGGVLMASLAALLGAHAGSGGATMTAPARGAHFEAAPGHARAASAAQALRVSENQLAQVLDYAGVAVWDWNRDGGHQTLSFGDLMGADSAAAFTPEAFRAFVDPADLDRFDRKVLGPEEGDGGFDELLKLHSGKRVRLRGARAVDRSGALERIVVFLEEANSATEKDAASPNALKLAAASLTGAALAAAKTEPAASASAPASSTKATSKKSAASKAVEAPPADAALAHPIASALEKGDIVAAFQPIVAFDTKKACGAEALLRWAQGSDGGKGATTEEIVRMAHLTDNGRALADLMLKATAAHVAEKVKAGDPAYFAAFNLSASQLAEAGFVDRVKAAIKEYKLPPKSLVIEVTEAERLSESPETAAVFKALRAAGAALAYDDFGAGYSSLSNLHKYDFDYLKIDKSFIDDIVANGGKKKVAAAIARLGREFGMTVIAEGVETKEAGDIAKAIGCKMGQGYFLGEPTVAPIAAAPVTLAGDAPILAKPADDAGEIVLDRNLEAPRPTSRASKRRLFGGGLR